MRVIKNVDLSNLTTIRLGGTASCFYEPETEAELIKCIVDNPEIEYFIGGGSNLLINERVFEGVISLKKFNDNILHIENGRYIVGASVKLIKLINIINTDGYGGIEYLCTVPGLVGGAVAMNAGTGIKENLAISDYILSVKVYDKEAGSILTINKDECGFAHRSSMFKSCSRYIILEVQFVFKPQKPEISQILRSDKRAYSRYHHDYSAANFGSVFSVFDPMVLKIVKRLGYGNSRGVHFSKKTLNWILKEKDGNYQEAKVFLNRIIWVHKMLHKKCKLEVVVWE